MIYDIKQSGLRIRQLRLKSGFTQEKIAESLGVDRSFYSRIESGKKGCSVDLLIQFSELYHVSLDYLILGRYGGAASNLPDLSLDRKCRKEASNNSVVDFCLYRHRIVVTDFWNPIIHLTCLNAIRRYGLFCRLF